MTAPADVVGCPARGQRPVPRIIMRANQQLVQGPLRVTSQGITYEDPRPSDWDDEGILWARVVGTDTGRPMYPSFHPLRQRAAMEDPRRLLCQFGLGPATVTSDGVLWLVPKPEGTERDPDRPEWPEGRTAEPPVCAAHALVAARWCPRLRDRGYAAVFAGRAELVAVEGTAYRPAGGLRVSRVPHSLYELDPAPGARDLTDPRFLLAEHLVRDLRDLTPVGLDLALFRDAVACDAVAL